MANPVKLIRDLVEQLRRRRTPGATAPDADASARGKVTPEDMADIHGHDPGPEARRSVVDKQGVPWGFDERGYFRRIGAEDDGGVADIQAFIDLLKSDGSGYDPDDLNRVITNGIPAQLRRLEEMGKLLQDAKARGELDPRNLADIESMLSGLWDELSAGFDNPLDIQSHWANKMEVGQGDGGFGAWTEYAENVKPESLAVDTDIPATSGLGRYLEDNPDAQIRALTEPDSIIAPEGAQDAYTVTINEHGAAGPGGSVSGYPMATVLEPFDVDPVTGALKTRESFLAGDLYAAAEGADNPYAGQYALVRNNQAFLIGQDGSIEIIPEDVWRRDSWQFGEQPVSTPPQTEGAAFIRDLGQDLRAETTRLRAEKDRLDATPTEGMTDEQVAEHTLKQKQAAQALQNSIDAATEFYADLADEGYITNPARSPQGLDPTQVLRRKARINEAEARHAIDAMSAYLEGRQPLEITNAMPPAGNLQKGTIADLTDKLSEGLEKTAKVKNSSQLPDGWRSWFDARRQKWSAPPGFDWDTWLQAKLSDVSAINKTRPSSERLRTWDGEDLEEFLYRKIDEVHRAKATGGEQPGDFQSLFWSERELTLRNQLKAIREWKRTHPGEPLALVGGRDQEELILSELADLEMDRPGSPMLPERGGADPIAEDAFANYINPIKTIADFAAMQRNAQVDASRASQLPITAHDGTVHMVDVPGGSPAAARAFEWLRSEGLTNHIKRLNDSRRAKGVEIQKEVLARVLEESDRFTGHGVGLPPELMGVLKVRLKQIEDFMNSGGVQSALREGVEGMQETMHALESQAIQLKSVIEKSDALPHILETTGGTFPQGAADYLYTVMVQDPKLFAALDREFSLNNPDTTLGQTLNRMMEIEESIGKTREDGVPFTDNELAPNDQVVPFQPFAPPEPKPAPYSSSPQFKQAKELFRQLLKGEGIHEYPTWTAARRAPDKEYGSSAGQKALENVEAKVEELESAFADEWSDPPPELAEYFSTKFDPETGISKMTILSKKAAVKGGAKAKAGRSAAKQWLDARNAARQQLEIAKQQLTRGAGNKAGKLSKQGTLALSEIAEATREDQRFDAGNIIKTDGDPNNFFDVDGDPDAMARLMQRVRSGEIGGEFLALIERDGGVDSFFHRGILQQNNPGALKQYDTVLRKQYYPAYDALPKAKARLQAAQDALASGEPGDLGLRKTELSAAMAEVNKAYADMQAAKKSLDDIVETAVPGSVEAVRKRVVASPPSDATSPYPVQEPTLYPYKRETPPEDPTKWDNTVKSWEEQEGTAEAAAVLREGMKNPAFVQLRNIYLGFKKNIAQRNAARVGLSPPPDSPLAAEERLYLQKVRDLQKQLEEARSTAEQKRLAKEIDVAQRHAESLRAQGESEARAIDDDTGTANSYLVLAQRAYDQLGDATSPAARRAAEQMIQEIEDGIQPIRTNAGANEARLKGIKEDVSQVVVANENLKPEIESRARAYERGERFEDGEPVNINDIETGQLGMNAMNLRELLGGELPAGAEEFTPSGPLYVPGSNRAAQAAAEGLAANKFFFHQFQEGGLDYSSDGIAAAKKAVADADQRVNELIGGYQGNPHDLLRNVKRGLEQPFGPSLDDLAQHNIDRKLVEDLEKALIEQSRAQSAYKQTQLKPVMTNAEPSARYFRTPDGQVFAEISVPFSGHEVRANVNDVELKPGVIPPSTISKKMIVPLSEDPMAASGYVDVPELESTIGVPQSYLDAIDANKAAGQRGILTIGEDGRPIYRLVGPSGDEAELSAKNPRQRVKYDNLPEGERPATFEEYLDASGQEDSRQLKPDPGVLGKVRSARRRRSKLEGQPPRKVRGFDYDRAAAEQLAQEEELARRQELEHAAQEQADLEAELEAQQAETARLNQELADKNVSGPVKIQRPAAKILNDMRRHGPKWAAIGVGAAGAAGLAYDRLTNPPEADTNEEEKPPLLNRHKLVPDEQYKPSPPPLLRRHKLVP